MCCPQLKIVFICLTTIHEITMRCKIFMLVTQNEFLSIHHLVISVHCYELL